MKHIKGQVYVAIVCVILGLMIAYQFRAVKNYTYKVSNAKINELTEQINDAQKEKESLENHIKELEGKIQKYEHDASNSSSIAKGMKEDLENIRVLAGLTNVQGPGVVITISPQNKDFNSTEPNEVPYEALVLMVNELNAADAEAIMINKQRIVSRTQIRDGGSYIVINGVRFSKYDKFEIKAIGNPSTLQGAVEMVGGLKDFFTSSIYGLNVTTHPSDDLVIFKCNKIFDFQYAKPIKEGE